MKGWCRIGVVLSVLWFVGFGVWGWIAAHDNVSKNYSAGLRHCYSMSSFKREPIRWDDPQREQKSAKIDAEETACANEASTLFNYQWNNVRLWVILLVDAASIALFWFLAWIIVCVGRWVAAGFRPQQAR